MKVSTPKVIGFAGFVVALAGLALSIMERSPLPSVAPIFVSDYPDESSCEGVWIFKEYQACQDPTAPIYELVTDKLLCKTSSAPELRKQYEYAECEHPSHGIAGYRSKKTYASWSPWKPSGYNITAFCNELRNRAQVDAGQPIDWQVIKTDEKKKHNFWRVFSYRYYCEAVASWGPLYNRARTKECGPAAPELVNVEVPNTCEDKSKVIGYKISRRPECKPESEVRVATMAEYNDLRPRIKNKEISWHQCTTCEAWAREKKRDNYAECLITSAYYVMEKGEDKDMSKIQRLLAALFSNREGLKSDTATRVRNQLAHLKGARP
jgi:hypothetical protein